MANLVASCRAAVQDRSWEVWTSRVAADARTIRQLRLALTVAVALFVAACVALVLT